MDAAALRSAVTTLGALPQRTDLSAVRRTIESVIRNPAQDRQLTLIVLAGAVVVFLLIVVFAALLFTPSKRRVVRRVVMVEEALDGDTAPVAEPVPQASPPSPVARVLLALTGPWMGLVLLFAALAVVYSATSSDSYCSRTCHSSSAMVVSAVRSRHAACVSCHERPGVFGLLPNSVGRVRMALDAARRQGVSGEAGAVGAEGCLACHRDILRDTTTSSNGVRMSHREVLKQARPCTRCHQSVGHGGAVYTRAMSPCITCHDGGVTSAECATCHSSDPAVTRAPSLDSTPPAGSGRIQYAAVRAAGRNCDGCHQMEKSCDPCHGGIRMPHSESFVRSAHARPAAFSGKTACFRCHAIQDCGQCHGAPFDLKTGLGGHPDWRQGHKSASWDAGCACHEGRTRRRGSMCDLCHDPRTHELLPVEQ